MLPCLKNRVISVTVVEEDSGCRLITNAAGKHTGNNIYSVAMKFSWSLLNKIQLAVGSGIYHNQNAQIMITTEITSNQCRFSPGWR